MLLASSRIQGLQKFNVNSREISIRIMVQKHHQQQQNHPIVFLR